MTDDYSLAPCGLINAIRMHEYTWRDRLLDRLDTLAEIVRFMMLWVVVGVLPFLILLHAFAHAFVPACGGTR